MPNAVATPLVSICIPAYNAAATLKETIESVLAQTIQNFEILLQDNASTDRTWAMMQEMAASDPRIKPLRNDSNLGMVGNWNTTFARSTSDYVLLLSADDCLLPEFLKTAIEELTKRPELVNVSTDHWLFSGTGDNTSQRARKVHLDQATYTNHAAIVLLKNPFSINFTLFNRKNLLSIVNSGPPFRRYLTCDYDLHIRIALSGKPVMYIDQRLARYRLHDANLSRQRRRMTRQALLTVLSHKKALSREISFAYRFTLMRFLTRAVLFPLRGAAWDHRLVSLIAGRLLRGTN